jgi:CHRD domain
MKVILWFITSFFTIIAIPTTACADTISTYDTPLSAASESPAVASTAVGFAIVTINTTNQTIEVNVTFSGLTSGNIAAHIQCCTSTAGSGNSGVASVTPTFTGFPSGNTSGSYDHVFDLTASSTYNPIFVTDEGGVANAEAALLAGLADGEAYLNIHTTDFPGGEIRGFLAPTATAPMPDPSSVWLLGFGLLALVGARKVKLPMS